MAISAHDRQHLHSTLIEALGAQGADTLMDQLPTIPWAEFATKDDLRMLEERLELRFDRIDGRFVSVDDHFARVDGRFVSVDDHFAIDGRTVASIIARVGPVRQHR